MFSWLIRLIWLWTYLRVSILTNVHYVSLVWNTFRTTVAFKTNLINRIWAKVTDRDIFHISSWYDKATVMLDEFPAVTWIWLVFLWAGFLLYHSDLIQLFLRVTFWAFLTSDFHQLIWACWLIYPWVDVTIESICSVDVENSIQRKGLIRSLRVAWFRDVLNLLLFHCMIHVLPLNFMPYSIWS